MGQHEDDERASSPEVDFDSWDLQVPEHSLSPFNFAAEQSSFPVPANYAQKQSNLPKFA